jgi:hypothetical protein
MLESGRGGLKLCDCRIRSHSKAESISMVPGLRTYDNIAKKIRGYADSFFLLRLTQGTTSASVLSPPLFLLLLMRCSSSNFSTHLATSGLSEPDSPSKHIRITAFANTTNSDDIFTINGIVPRSPSTHRRQQPPAKWEYAQLESLLTVCLIWRLGTQTHHLDYDKF